MLVLPGLRSVKEAFITRTLRVKAGTLYDPGLK